MKSTWRLEMFDESAGSWSQVQDAHGPEHFVRGWFSALSHFYPRKAMRVLDPEGSVKNTDHTWGSQRAKDAEVVDGGHSIQELVLKLQHAEARNSELGTELRALISWQTSAIQREHELETELQNAADALDTLTEILEATEATECAQANTPTSGNTASSYTPDSCSKAE